MEDEAKFGDFEEVKEEGEEIQTVDEQGIPTRVRTPRKGEFIGVIVQRLGGNRMEVLCSDGKTRNCRVPGRFKRSMWLRPKDFVLVQPWLDNDDKADVIFHYKNQGALNQLRKRGFLDNLKVEF
jgi:translation initiation factor 1A